MELQLYKVIRNNTSMVCSNFITLLSKLLNLLKIVGIVIGFLNHTHSDSELSLHFLLINYLESINRHSQIQKLSRLG